MNALVFDVFFFRDYPNLGVYKDGIMITEHAKSNRPNSALVTT